MSDNEPLVDPAERLVADGRLGLLEDAAQIVSQSNTSAKTSERRTMREEVALESVFIMDASIVAERPC